MSRTRVVFIPKLGDEFVFKKVYHTKHDASKALDAIAQYTIMLHECSLMPDYSNVGFLEQQNDEGEWCDIDEL